MDFQGSAGNYPRVGSDNQVESSDHGGQQISPSMPATLFYN